MKINAESDSEINAEINVGINAGITVEVDGSKITKAW